MMMKNPVHPGRIIRTCIEDLELSVTDAAKVLGVSRPTLSSLINGHAGISPEMAIRLHKAFGGTPEGWFRMQTAYDLAEAQENSDKIKIERYQPKQKHDERQVSFEA
jgi:addiction module HigA family antidote